MTISFSLFHSLPLFSLYLFLTLLFWFGVDHNNNVCLLVHEYACRCTNRPHPNTSLNVSPLASSKWMMYTLSYLKVCLLFLLTKSCDLILKEPDNSVRKNSNSEITIGTKIKYTSSSICWNRIGHSRVTTFQRFLAHSSKFPTLRYANPN